MLNLLGWKMRSGRNTVTIESGEKAGQAKRQDLAAALAIDQAAMQDAFRSKKPFVIEIPWEWAATPLPEGDWRKEFFPKENPPGGLAEALCNNVNAAKVFLGLAAVDEATARMLGASIGLKALAEKYADRLSQYSVSLAVANGRLVVPGGPQAEPVWAKLAGADPNDLARFARALLEKEDGRLLAFFFELSQLDYAHQRFFTLNAQRAMTFFEAFLDDDVERRRLGISVPRTFGEFLREVPLENGSVAFPGSPEIWLVAKGESKTPSKTLKLVKKAHKKATPDVEDKILLRLAGTRYKKGNVRRSELDNCVCQLDLAPFDALIWPHLVFA